jgi:hypothetical protein
MHFAVTAPCIPRAAQAASTSVGARRAHTARGRVVGRLRARQKGVTPRSKIPDSPRRHQGDRMGRSPRCRLHDHPSDASNRLSCLALQRDALRRQFDHVRPVSAKGSSCFQFDQRDQSAAPAVRAIHSGYHLPVATGPECPLRVGEPVILQLPGHPLICSCRAPANGACCGKGRYDAGHATGDKKPELSGRHGLSPDRQEVAWRPKPVA